MPSPDAPREPALEWKRLFGLLRFAQGMRGAFVAAYVFHAFQILTYHALSYSLRFLIDDFIPLREGSFLLAFLAAYVCCYALHAWCTVRSAAFKIRIVREMVAGIRGAIIKKLQVLQMRRLQNDGAGAISVKILQDVDRAQAFYGWFLDGFVSAVFAFLLSFPFLWSLNPWLTLCVAAYAPVTPIIQKLVKRRLVRESNTLRDATQGLSRQVIEFISGLKHIRVSATEDIHGRSALESIHAVRDADVRFGVSMRWLSMGMQFLSDVVPVVLWIGVGVALIYGADMPTGQAVAFVTLTSRAIGFLQSAFGSFEQVVAASPSVAAISQLVEQADVENAGARTKDFVLHGGVHVRGLHFTYPTREGTEQLSDISLDLAPGEKIALVGPSGSGKTTLVEVLLGLYERRDGTVEFDGRPIDTLDLPTLRAQIAIVSQETFLFRASILDNLRFARPDATFDEIREACRKAEILDFIEALPDGFDTPVGERGAALSGGQRQRIGVARAFLRRAAIVILDEPSSALDAVTEQRLMRTLYDHLDGRTLIVIAHRLSTIRGVDRVVVFDRGRIVEQGTPETLIDQGGTFRALVEGNRSGFSHRLRKDPPS